MSVKMRPCQEGEPQARRGKDLLCPSPTIHKILISSPCKLVGEYVADDFLLTHCWAISPKQAEAHLFHSGSPLSRSFLVVAFETEPLEKDASGHPRVYPRWEPLGEYVCTCLAVLFGKRFDCHGMLETHGLFQLPRLEGLQPVFFRALPFANDKSRPDLPLELNLAACSRIECLFRWDHLHPDFFDTFLTAGRFYLRALRYFQDDPELAYLDLITCGETLSQTVNFEWADLCDEQLLSVLGRIEEGGLADVVPLLRRRLYQTKRRFVKTAMGLLTDRFFTVTESLQEECRLQRDVVGRRIGAAYDLRSLYLHTGKPFGEWMVPMKMLNEVPVGKPLVEPAEYAKALELAPTFSGLERITRFCLLRFAHLAGVGIDDVLNGPGIESLPPVPSCLVQGNQADRVSEESEG